MARLILVRHGEAAAGWGEDPDPGLSPTGRDQATRVGDVLAPIGPLRLVTSPLRRTRETAAPLARHWGLDAVVEPRVGEIVSPTPLAERGAWLRDVMAGRWSDADAAVRDWRADVVAALLDQPADAVVVSHFVAVNAALSWATGDERVVCARVGHCARTVFSTDGGVLTHIEGPDDTTPTTVL